MILLYTLALCVLAAVKALTALRAASLERRFTKVAGVVLKLVSAPLPKMGNAARADLCASAKQTFELGRLVQKRDTLEAKYFKWRGWSDKLTSLLTGLRIWKGKKLPYTMGALDIWLALYLIDQLGIAEHLSARRLLDSILSLFGLM